MKKLKTKNSINMEFFSEKKEMEMYAQIGKIAHELFHDLLNPITGFMLYMDLGERSQKNNIDLVKNKEEINDSIKRIRRFIKLIQDSILSNNKKEVLNLNENIEEIMSILYYKAKRNNISLIFIREENIKIKIEKIKLYQLIINLLSNAIDSYEKINDGRKRQIILKTEKTDDHLSITIMDNGCGIEKINLDKIFNLNYTNKENGFGIGLKTVKKIVEINLKGKIKYSSIINKGSIFSVLIPRSH